MNGSGVEVREKVDSAWDIDDRKFQRQRQRQKRSDEKSRERKSKTGRIDEM